MLPPDLPRHRLPGNANERTPYHVLYLDTETDWHSDGLDEVHQLRMWYGQHLRRHTGKGWKPDQGDCWGTTAVEIAEYVERVCTTKHPLYLFTHNLNFDLGVTKLPLVLMERGWELKRQSLASEAPWANLQLGKRSVWLVDSFGWLRVSLQEAGDRLHIAKAPLPAADDSEEAWYGRVRADVDILAAAMTQLLDWWDQEHLGHWSFTGPGCGWNAMRHMCDASRRALYLEQRRDRPGGTIEPIPGTVVITTDPGVRSFERQAIYQGWRGCNYVGQLQEGAWANLDLRQAHLRIAAQKLLPCKLIDRGDSLPVDSPRIGGRLRGVLARCRVRTPEPRYPVREGDHILHPVGEFWTVLCDPELVAARDAGDLLEVGEWQEYLLNGYMQPWARWIWAILDGECPGTPPAAEMAAKAWSRTVIGKWATRTSRWEKIGQTEDWGWCSAPPLPTAGDQPPGYAQIGHDVFDVHRDQEGDNAFPAVLAWVQSWVRVQLRELIQELGPADVVQWNTDGVVMDAKRAGMAAGGWDEQGRPDPATWQACAAAARSVGEALGEVEVRCKGLYRGGWVLSPQHLVLDGWRVMAGIPRRVERVEGWRYSFLSWPSLAGQMQRGLEDGYRRRWTTRDMSHIPVSRWVMEDGCALPATAILGPGGHLQLEPGGECTCAHRSPPRPEQAPWLLRLSGER